MFFEIVKKCFSLLLRAIGVFSVLVLLFFVIKFIYYNILNSYLPKVYEIISQSDYQHLPTTLIAIDFTLMGFAITLRNILLGRYSNEFNGFSMKSIIECSTTKYCRACWYIVVSIPFFSIVLYFFGYRRQLYFYTMLSGFCMIVYFLTVLGRLRNKDMRKTIAYIIAEEVFNRNELYDEEYRKELIGKLCLSGETLYRSKIIFSETLNVLYDIIHVQDCSFLKKRYFWFRTIIQDKIKKKLKAKEKEKDYQHFEKSICGFSLYSFDYYSQLFLNYSNEERFYPAYYCEILDTFTSKRESKKDINIFSLKNYYLVDPSKRNESDFIKERKSDAEYIYMLVINLILGLFCACASNCSIETINEIHNTVANICENNCVFIEKKTIDALMLLSIYYIAESNILYQDIYIDEMIAFCNRLFINTSYFDYDFLRDFIDKDFFINNEKISVCEVLDKLSTERKNSKSSIDLFLYQID